MKLTIAGTELELTERPKHKAVMQVQNLMTEWLMERIDASEFDSSISIEVAIQQALLKDPTMAIAITQMQQTLLIDQTIMLATGLTYKQLGDLKDEAYEDEYQDLYRRSCDAIGGTAADFFVGYGTNSISREMISIEPNSESETSTSQPNSLSEILTEHSTDEMSTNQD